VETKIAGEYNMIIDASQTMDADYLIVGAGATGMAFADVVLAESKARIIIVDRRDQPGGHWNDAYPFVRLHQPAAFYGVTSQALGEDRINRGGLNAGHHELSSKAQIVDYYDRVMRHTFLTSGRVTWLPKTDYVRDGDRHVLRSLLGGSQREVQVSKLVDATTADVQIPATHTPKYEYHDGAAVVPINALADIRGHYANYTVVGAGKTGMDACIWLLEHGVLADAISWIVPNDYWIIPREVNDSFKEMALATTRAFEAVASMCSIDGLLESLERDEVLLRIDSKVWPTAYHCANLSQGELAILRRIKNVIRKGRLLRIEPDRILLERGERAVQPNTLYVDCSASAIQRDLDRPVFETGMINLQFIRWCQPLFSAALIGFVECHFEDDAKRNKLCAPVRLPSVPADWLDMWRDTLLNVAEWEAEPKVSEWISDCRLDALSSLRRRDLSTPEDDRILDNMMRAITKAGPAIQRLATHKSSQNNP
jgi:hypothetical protein